MKLSFVKQYQDYKSSVYEEIANRDKYLGVKWSRFEPLNEILKGHREGELTVFTGTTGCGKTTFLSEYSLDLASKGVKTLWGSFEIKNNRLIKIMMKQFSRANLENNVHLFEPVSKEFAKLPLYFMNFHGEETIENVIRVRDLENLFFKKLDQLIFISMMMLQTMSNSCLLYGINHVVIDNLQFMVGTQFSGTFDRYFCFLRFNYYSFIYYQS